MQGAGGAVLRMRAALISSFTVLPEVVTTLIGKSDRAAALLIFRVRASFTNGIFRMYFGPGSGVWVWEGVGGWGLGGAGGRGVVGMLRFVLTYLSGYECGDQG